MTAMTVSCDRCGAAIESCRTHLAAETGPFRASWQRCPVSGNPAIDLCAPCAQALATWLAARPGLDCQGK